MDERRFLVEAEMHDLPFPIRVVSRQNPDGQLTIAKISISARIMDQFQARWIDRFIQVVHQHRSHMSTQTLQADILDYLKALHATSVRLIFEFPFFMEQITPVSCEKCLVQYACLYSAEVNSADHQPKITFQVQVPVITTYPGSVPEKPGGLFGQSSVITMRIQSQKEIYPEDLIDTANRHALSPVYSFLTEADQEYVIQQVHSQTKSSLVVLDEIRQELAHNRSLEWYSVHSANYGILHPYSTVIGIEKSHWVPFTGTEDEL